MPGRRMLGRRLRWWVALGMMRGEMVTRANEAAPPATSEVEPARDSGVGVEVALGAPSSSTAAAGGELAAEAGAAPAVELDPQVSVIVPCYDEAESLPALHAEIEAALDGAGLVFEVIYVDDGSRDGTFELLQGLHEASDRVEVIRLRRNSGKAAALAAGFEHARGPVLCTLDADLQDDPRELPPLIHQVQRGQWDLVVGWKQRRHDPWTKVLPSRVFNWMLRRVTRAPLHDFNCGLKVLARDVARSAPMYGDLYRFLPAFAATQGYAVTEVAVHHRPRAHGRSKYGASRFLRGFLDLFTVLLLTRFRFRPLHLFGGLGLMLSLFGFAVMGYLSVLWLQGEPIGHRPLLLFGVLLFLTGLQGVAIGLIAEMIGYARSSRPEAAVLAQQAWSHRGQQAGTAVRPAPTTEPLGARRSGDEPS